MLRLRRYFKSPCQGTRQSGTGVNGSPRLCRHDRRCRNCAVPPSAGERPGSVWPKLWKLAAAKYHELQSPALYYLLCLTLRAKKSATH
eukprot:9488598-Pyramimonas_sp.AAC.1